MSKSNGVYCIIRFFAPHLRRSNEVIHTGLTLAEAQEHCNDPATREPGIYFDGYQVMEGVR